MTRKCVLLLDDDQAVLLSYSKLFHRLGVEIDTAETVEEAKDLLRKHCYEVVIADLSLTGMGGEQGLEVISHVRECYPATRVILMTAYGSHKVIKRAFDLGASFYFEKPVPVETLRDALDQLGVISGT